MAELEVERQSLQAEQEEFEKHVKAAVKIAGHARARVVEHLYELFGIDAVTKTRRNSDGTETTVQVDKAEEERSELLFRAIEEKIAESEELRQQLASHQTAMLSQASDPPYRRVQQDEEQAVKGASASEGAPST